MQDSHNWTREQLLVAFALYCRLPFGQLHHRHPEIIRFATGIGRSPSALAMKLGNIASMDPAITSTGRSGLANASAADHAMWEEMHNDWERFAMESEQAVQAITEAETVTPPTDGTGEDEGHDRIGEDRAVETTVRVGQKFFRTAVLSAYHEQCCITRLSLPTLLVASHIIPWSHDKRNRMNPRNGLLLSVLHDKAFDAGIITLNNDMTVRVSRVGKDDEFFSSSIASYDGHPISLPEKFGPDREFLRYHREHIFQG